LATHVLAEPLADDGSVVGRLDEFRGRDRIQRAREPLVGTGTLRARAQMMLRRRHSRTVLTVVVQNEFVVAEVTHRPLP
jgi:hypothetical protein